MASEKIKRITGAATPGIGKVTTPVHSCSVGSCMTACGMGCTASCTEGCEVWCTRSCMTACTTGCEVSYTRSTPICVFYGGAKAPVVISNADGRLEVFAIGSDKSLYHGWQTAPNNGWSENWESLGGQMKYITAARNADGRLEVFAVFLDNTLWHIWQTEHIAGWSSWEFLGSGHTGEMFNPLVAQNADGRLEVFVRTNNALWHICQVLLNTWPNLPYRCWSPLGGNIDEFAVAKSSDDCLEVFAIGSDKTLWHIRQTQAGVQSDLVYGWTGWGNWEQLSDRTIDSFKVAQNADGRLEIFAIVGTDNTLWHIWQTRANDGTSNLVWSSWAQLGDHNGISGLTIAQNADGRLEVFALGVDTTIWHIWQTEHIAGWSSWQSLGSELLGDRYMVLLAVARNADGRLDVFALGTLDNTIWHIWQTAPNTAPNNDWSSWQSLGYHLAPSPTIDSFSPTSGLVETNVTIKGNYFDVVKTIEFGNANALASNSYSDLQMIKTVVPANAVTGAITVVTARGSATSSAIFTVLHLPGIGSFSPSSGKVGDPVTITGEYFDAVKKVEFGNANALAQFSIKNSQTIVAAVPPNAVTGAITVIVNMPSPAGASATSNGIFTVLQTQPQPQPEEQQNILLYPESISDPALCHNYVQDNNNYATRSGKLVKIQNCTQYHLKIFRLDVSRVDPRKELILGPNEVRQVDFIFNSDEIIRYWCANVQDNVTCEELGSTEVYFTIWFTKRD